jgi:hypothetical protein
MDFQGGLHIRLAMQDSAVRAVSIKSDRPVLASRVFQGKGVAESQEMLPLLFSICSTAQACAGARACEQALGRPAIATVQRLRDLLVNTETVREHLWRILLDWPAFTGGEPDRAGMIALVAIQRDLQRALCPGDNAFRIGGARCVPNAAALPDIADRLDGLLHRSVFAMSAARWLAIEDEGALTAWAGTRETAAAALIDRVIQLGWHASGACEAKPLPPLESSRLNAAMREREFIHRPCWLDACCETSSLTRTASPLLGELGHRYGNGLLVRLVARLTELARLAGQLSPDQSKAAAATVSPITSNPGIGQAAAARGQLVHAVELMGERIVSYRILAPTQWNFHPQGVAVRALSALGGGPQKVEAQARLLISALDPCVDYELSLTTTD